MTTDVALSRTAAASPAHREARWLLLFHQIPPEPAYLRVKIGRRLARIGAVALKNTIYVLPRSEGALEDLQWVVQEIAGQGGDATICEARFVDGLTDREVEGRFHVARDEDYADLAREARELGKGRRKPMRPGDEGRAKLEADVARLEKRLQEIDVVDFFHAPGREAAAGLVRAMRGRLVEGKPSSEESVSRESKDKYQGKVWVTRTGVHVDRIASAWLVRRFVDPEARFTFVAAKGYEPHPGEIRFDMFDAEFTHEGDRCTFEVLAGRLGIDEPGVQALAEIVHDIDLKESKYERAETAGIAATIAGLCMLHREDETRLDHGFALFDHLQRHFSRRKS